MPHSTNHTADVIVIGAGLAGLAAANTLQQRAPKLRVVVLEARDRVGGRAYSVPFGPNGGVVDFGGQWLAPPARQPRACALAERLGLAFDEQLYPGAPDGNPGMSAAAGQAAPALTAEQQAEMQAVHDELHALSSVVSVEEPWRCGRANEWDAQSAQQFFESRCRDPVVLREFRLAVQTILAEEPERISLLYLLFFLKANSGFESVGDGVGGSQSLKVKGGMGGFAVAFADLVNQQHRRAHCSVGAATTLDAAIQLSSAVSSIHDWTHRSTSGVRVRCSNGTVWSAPHVIVAMAPLAAANIVFDPPLPDRKMCALRSLPMAAAAKVIVLYRTPFWIHEDPSWAANAKLAHFTTYGPVYNIFHTEVGGLPGLVGLIVGDSARQWTKLPADERRRVVLEQYRQVYQSDEALAPEAYIDNEWQSDQWALGCYGGVAPIGYLTDCGPFLRVATDRVLWAGTETATEWVGYFEGALVSGERAATDLLASPTMQQQLQQQQQAPTAKL